MKPATPTDHSGTESVVAASPSTRYFICVSDEGDRLSVLKGKVYRVLPPDPRDPDYYLRVVDETGDDYLYDRSWFEPVNLSQRAIEALETA